MNSYAELQNRLARGWNTWNTRSVLSHVHLPDGFALNLGIKQFKLTQYLKEALIARPEQREERVQPGLRSYDGSYTELCIEWKGVEIRVQSVAERDTLALLITPLARQRKTPLVVVEAGMLWNRPGYVCRSGNALKGHTPDKDFTAYATGALVEDPHIPAQTAYLALPLDVPVGITTQKPCSLAEITASVEQARLSEVKRVTGYGDVSEA